MKKILFSLLISFCLLSSVSAEELPNPPVPGMGYANSCSKNLYDPTFGVAYFQSGGFRPLSNMGTTSYPVPNNLIPVKPNTTYFYSSNFSTYGGIIELTENPFVPAKSTYQQWNNTTITTSSKTHYLSFWYYTSANSLSQYWYQLEEGSTKTDYVPYELCSSGPIADTTLDNFYTLFLDKISTLSKFATENKFILGAIGIVLLIVTLEIVLNLFRKGGYH